MPYEVTFRFDGEPEQQVEIEDAPSDPMELKILVHEAMDRDITVKGASLERWHERHASAIDVISIRQT